MTSLDRWYLRDVWGLDYVLKGIVTGHPKLPDDHSIHTSYLISITQDETHPERFIFRTANTDYHLTMEECHYERCRWFVQTHPTIPGLPGYEQWVSQFEKFAQRYELSEPECEAPDGTILLRLGTNRDYYFDSMDINLGNGQHLPTKMLPHVGMFQDSVLCLSGEMFCEDSYDLRYFPHRNGNIAFYYWETQGLPVYIENCGYDDLRVSFDQSVYLISPGERVMIDPQNAVPGLELTSKQDLYDVFDRKDDAQIPCIDSQDLDLKQNKNNT